MIFGLSMYCDYPTRASIPTLMFNGFFTLLALSQAADYSSRAFAAWIFKLEDMRENREKKKEELEEAKKEEDAEVSMGGLFDSDSSDSD